MRGIGVKACEGVDGLSGLGPLAQFGVEKGHAADDVPAKVDVRIARGGGEGGGLAVGFLQADNVSVRGAEYLDHLRLADLHTAVPDVEGHDAKLKVICQDWSGRKKGGGENGSGAHEPLHSTDSSVNLVANRDG
jgi:hypothetical protein